MGRLICCVLLVSLAACNERQQGERCNPLQYSDNGVQGDCADGLSCIYPTAPSCGIAYCCRVGSNGEVIDRDPHCQPDPSLASLCMLDLSGSPPEDAGARD